MKEILILNTGGTFNKIYNPINGQLEVSQNNKAIEKICEKFLKTNNNIKIQGLLFKDSLEMTKADRSILVNVIKNAKEKKIIIVHGTDTMDKTAEYLDKFINNKEIILVGTMVPFSIEPIEATANLCSAYGILQTNIKDGVYICMHGHIKKHTKMYKNREIGVFECLK